MFPDFDKFGIVEIARPRQIDDDFLLDLGRLVGEYQDPLA